MRPVFKPRFQAEKLAAKTPDLKLLAQKIAEHILSGPHATRKAGSGEAFWQYREYIPGDTPASIDWRQSGKTDRIFVREKEQHKTQSHFFWIKRNSDMDFSSSAKLLTKHQAGSVMALALALLHVRSGEVFAYAGETRASPSERNLQHLETLLLQTHPSALPDAALPLPAHCGLYILSDFLEPIEDLEKILKPLRARTRNITMIQILDPAEIALPYKGRIIFENTLSGARVLTNNADDIAKAYNARIDTHILQIKALCKNLGLSHRLYITNQNPEKFLLDLWKHTGGGA